MLDMAFLVQSGSSGFFRSPWVTCSGAWQALSITFLNNSSHCSFTHCPSFAKDKIVYCQEIANANFSAAVHWCWTQQYDPPLAFSSLGWAKPKALLINILSPIAAPNHLGGCYILGMIEVGTSRTLLWVSTFPILLCCYSSELHSWNVVLIYLCKILLYPMHVGSLHCVDCSIVLLSSWVIK